MIAYDNELTSGDDRKVRVHKETSFSQKTVLGMEDCVLATLSFAYQSGGGAMNYLYAYW